VPLRDIFPQGNKINCMAGNKETPRQRMIGMMYLVLTALLALNVSKEIVNAFIRLNDKIEDSNAILESKLNQDYDEIKFQMAVKETRVTAKLWSDKADAIRANVGKEITYLLNETNSLLQETEGKESKWLIDDKRTGNVKLRSLMDVEAKDDYDAATRLFVGGDPTEPIERGKQLRNRLQKLRDNICGTLGTYKLNNISYKFDPASVKNYDPKNPKTFRSLKEALKTVNKEDTAVVARIYKTLSYPLTLTEYDETTSWQGALFDHAPVVAAAAILTSLRSDIKTAESLAIDHLVGKLGEKIINVNKIEPVAFAPKGYLNVGDTMLLRVMIAAYDSNDVSKIHYSEDPEMKDHNEITGAMTIKATTPGIKNIYGKIAVKERGELKWKPWSFSYEVGAPSASISHKDLNVLYTGFDNNIEASASGYSGNEINLVGSGVTITKKGGAYVVNVPANMAGQKVKLYVMAKGKNVGNMEFRVKKVPRPSTYFGTFTTTDSYITRSQLLANISNPLRLGYDPDAIITVNFIVQSYKILVAVPNGPSKEIPVIGAKISLPDQEFLKKLRPGTSITFREIKGNSKGGPVRGSNISLTIQ
jgi:GldM N-terminal domain/GldM C-terminal domain